MHHMMVFANVQRLKAGLVCALCLRRCGRPPGQVPSGLLPVMELDGRVITESAVIMAMLEEQFPGNNPLMPPKGESWGRRWWGWDGRGGEGRWEWRLYVCAASALAAKHTYIHTLCVADAA